MSCRTRGSRSVVLPLVSFLGAGVLLAGCGGGDGGGSGSGTAHAAQPPATGATPPPSPAPGPAPSPTPTPTPSPDPVAPGANSAPTISGNAIALATTGSAYSFAPTASDADGDAIAFQIANKPAWLTFNTTSGQLSGTPSATDAGTYANITITASDGTASATLPAFSITVTQPAAAGGATLSWSPPTANTDGSTLSNLAGYTIAYGPSPTMLYESVRLNNPSVNVYTLDGLAAGTYYFAVTAFTAGGVQSSMSNVVSKVVR